MPESSTTQLELQNIKQCLGKKGSHVTTLLSPKKGKTGSAVLPG